VLAELCRRWLVPALSIPSLEERAMRERLKRRLHLVRLGTSAENRLFGLLTQWGLRISRDRLRRPDAMELLETRGVPEVWRRSGGRGGRRDRAARRADRCARPRAGAARPRRPARLLARHDPRHRPPARAIAAEIGDVARFQSPPKLIGYSGLAPRVKQSGQRSRSGELSKAGSRTLRFAAVEAAQGAWRETNPWHRLYSDVKARTGKANPAKSAVARKVLIARRHVLSREQPFKPRHPKQTLSRRAPPAFWPPDGSHPN
jgi:transposase